MTVQERYSHIVGSLGSMTLKLHFTQSALEEDVRKNPVHTRKSITIIIPLNCLHFVTIL